MAVAGTYSWKESLLKIEVCEVRRYCPVYKVGDKIMIEDPKIVLGETDALCIHTLSSLLHYVLILARGGDLVELGLTKPEDAEHAYIECIDLGEPICTVAL